MHRNLNKVATAPTACGIETLLSSSPTTVYSVATAPTACGIETKIET